MLQARAVVMRPDFRGVKVVLGDGRGRVLFVRHHYGDRWQWELPGGAARPGEPLAEAAAREAWEELGADVAVWRELGTAVGRWYGREERLTVFAAAWPGGPVRPDPVEIAVFAWHRLDDPPAPLGPATEATLRVAREPCLPAGR
ncbi:MAG TPA: NUDIX domain-containing protein [Solirubrobacteraceae bacterium]|nr:NUDIX domain-containing protein [Solirubrobacteraceae bacterium]